MADVQLKHTAATIDTQIDRVLSGAVVTENTDSKVTSDGVKPVSGAAVNSAISTALKTCAAGTPSGDPLHYMYELAGARYNNTLVGAPQIGMFGDVIDWKSKHWLLNELGDITTEEMRNIYQGGYFANGAGGVSQWFALSEDKRTNISKFNGEKSSIGMTYSYYSSKYHTISLSMTDRIAINGMTDTFTGCAVLEKILTILDVSYFSQPVKTPFARCAALKHVLIKGLKVNMPIGDSPLLSNDSILYMIQNSAATSPIVITLHADAYIRALENDEIEAALAAKPNVSLASA